MPCHLPVALLIPHDAATSALTAAVNRVAREVHQCQTLDPGSLSRSGERGTDAEPVFFVTCGSGAAMRNMWFKLDGTRVDRKSTSLNPITNPNLVCSPLLEKKTHN